MPETDAQELQRMENMKIEVMNFVNNPQNRVKVTPENENFTTCGDGRTAIKTARLRPTRQFGGDLSDIMVGIATLNEFAKSHPEVIQPQTDIFDVVIDSVMDVVGTTDGKSNFYMHTGDHGHHTEDVDSKEVESLADLLCGHWQAALESPDKYGLTKEEAQKLIEKLNLRLKNHISDYLHLSHAEKGVLSVEGEDVSVTTQNVEGEQWFVVTPDLIAKRNTKMVNGISKRLSLNQEMGTQLGTLYSHVKNVQQDATSQKLAAGKDIFRVKLTSLNAPAEVSHAGKVPVK